MKIERTADEVIVRLPGNIDLDDLQDLSDWLTYKETTKRANKVFQKQVDELVESIKKGTYRKKLE